MDRNEDKAPLQGVAQWWHRMLGDRTGEKLLRSARMVGAWLWFQVVEIGHELRRAVFPPVRVKRHGQSSIAVSVPGGNGEGVLLLPLAGDNIVGVHCVRGTTNEEFPFVVEAFCGRIERGGWLVGRFKTRDDADFCVDRISSAMAGGPGMARWVFGTAAAVLALVFLAALLRPAAVAADSKDAAKPTAPAAPPAVADVLRDAFGFNRGAAGSGPATAPAAAAAANGESLADQIYQQAMAASEQSVYAAGPPQSPIENPQVGGFGLGTSSKEGCDPALKFTVAAKP